MNYEELLESRNGAAMAKESMPFGQLYKKMQDNKYVNVIDLREDLLDSLVFTDALTNECERNKQLNHKGQLHFTLALDSAGLYGVKVEQGTYRTFERLLEDNPAVVAEKDFVIRTVEALLDVTSYLHGQNVFHVCYAPNNVIARKNDAAPMLLFHGSAYKAVNDQTTLYGSAADFVAPEVLEEGVIDARSDIYSIGRFMEYLYQQSEVPLELKGVIKKATDEDPEKRFQSPEEMRKAISRRQYVRQSLLTLVGALVVAAIVFGVYQMAVPEPEDIEFVKPALRQEADDLLDDGFDPDTELGVMRDTDATHIDDKQMRVYASKAEQIFRKQYTRKAEAILSKIYNNERMNATEMAFRAGSQSTMEELVNAQMALGSDAGLPVSRSQLIASEIIETVSNRLKSQATARRAQKAKDQPAPPPAKVATKRAAEPAKTESAEPKAATTVEKDDQSEKNVMERQHESEEQGKPLEE